MRKHRQVHSVHQGGVADRAGHVFVPVGTARMIAKLENLGCQVSVVGLVIPTGYSFNLDGTCIYLTMAALFLAQATNTELTVAHQLGIIGVLLLTSKRAAGVPGCTRARVRLRGGGCSTREFDRLRAAAIAWSGAALFLVNAG